MKTMFSFFLSLMVFTLPLNILTMQPNYERALADRFFDPVEFTRAGIEHFLHNVFNTKDYSERFLPYDFSHLIQFLKEGTNNQQECTYIEYVIRLFSNKLKTTHYVSAYAFNDMLVALPSLMKNYCAQCSEETLISNAIASVKDILYNTFLGKFSIFKTDPDLFFDELSHIIVTTLHEQQSLTRNVAKEELRQTLIRFLDIGLLKTIWSPVDQELCWESVKNISNNLNELMEQSIINQDELDDLCKSLVESFCKFLDLAGSELSLEVINKIKDDINAGSLLLFSLEEQEELLETKCERLTKALIEAEAKIHARHQGIITETIVIN